MNLKFDYYHNLESPDLFLCNPDGRELFPVVGTERTLTLRFNDLSELSFTCYSITTSSSGADIPFAYYDWLQTRRLVFLERVGWFIIKKVDEHDDGVIKYKSVVCESLQAIFKDRGFYSEERVYHFYNPSDPTDANYNPDDEASIPSVVGQLYQQLGIKQALAQGLSDPSTPYADWTITYINSEVKTQNRNFKENTTYGYDFMIKDAADAFEAVFLFDFMYRTIHIMIPSEITEKANVLYSFSNFMKDVDIEEDAENIVTVLQCNGDNCDISGVNPTGTNYICDFSYYMDSAGRWMSADLKAIINAWKTVVNNNKTTYRNKVLALREAYANRESVRSSLQEISRVYTDLSAAVARKSVAIAANSPTTLYGIVWAETVEVGSTSLDTNSSYYSSAFTASKTLTCYKDAPSFNENTRTWSFSGSYISGTAEYCYGYVDGSNNQYHYFMDAGSGSYCKLEGKAVINSTTFATDYTVKGFKRYVDLNIANVWMKKYESVKVAKETAIAGYDATIGSLQSDLQSIANTCNILKYFAANASATLIKELYCYWIEGDYTNDNISVMEDTTQSEALDLEQELLEAGELELSKVCQPKLQFSLSSVDCSKLYEFRNQVKELELGKIITVEKEEGLWYYPALLEIEINLDKTDTFGLKFANALRLDDWGYTYGDLMSDASATTRQVSANWQDFMQYARDREQITDLIRDPLSKTLRAAFANMTNQEFTIDETGILGRKFEDDSTKDSFVDEQLRIINNVIIFTDDNWETAKTALGKIYYADPDPNSATYGQLISKYGLIAETIIGSLVMSETLKIINSDNTVVLDENGISIKHNSQEVFKVTTDGSMTITGYATSSDLSDGLSEKNRVLRQASAPSTSDYNLIAGDLWIDSDDDNKLYRYNGSTWVEVLGNQNKVYAQTTHPNGETCRVGDLWVDTDDDNKMYRWNGTSWVSILANQNKTYAQASQPSGGTYRVGDLWIDTDDSNKLYRYNGLTWSAVADTRVNGVVNEVQVLYYLKSSSSAPSAPSSWVTATSTTAGAWTRKVPTPTAGYYYFGCTQTKSLDGTVTTSAVRSLDTDNTILDWCASADTTKIDGGKIYTGSIYASSLNASSIVTNLLTVKDSSNNVLFKADAANKSVSIAGFTVKNGALYSNSHSSLNDTSYSGVYIGSDGIGILSSGGTHSLKLDIANATFTFRGAVYATSGSFTGAVYASSGTFTGSITATSGELQSGCKLGPSLYVGTSDNSLSTGLTNNPDLIGTMASYLPTYSGDHEGFYLYTPASVTSYTSALSFHGYLGYSGGTYKSQAAWMNSGGFYVDIKKTGVDNVITRGGLHWSNYSWSHVELEIGDSTIDDYAGDGTHGKGAKLMGTWYTASSIIVDSDANIKTDIENINNKFDAFFDALVPRSYKYIDGTSNRKHTGFVAQEVAQALTAAEISTTDFAGYAVSQTRNDEGELETTCGLRYEEFVSLNTWQIQKLKQRVAALEATIARLQS